NKALVLNPRNTAVYFNRGVVRGQLNDREGAIQDYNKAALYSPKNKDVWFNRGTERMNKDDYSGAISDFSKSIGL
ncbi:tetratricopeptide repeat protein, partial [Vibrio parahaemolyticus]